MKRYEYFYTTAAPPNFEDGIRKLNLLSETGWRVVAPLGGHYFDKSGGIYGGTVGYLLEREIG